MKSRSSSWCATMVSRRVSDGGGKAETGIDGKAGTAASTFPPLHAHSQALAAKAAILASALLSRGSRRSPGSRRDVIMRQRSRRSFHPVEGNRPALRARFEHVEHAGSVRDCRGRSRLGHPCARRALTRARSAATLGAMMSFACRRRPPVRGPVRHAGHRRGDGGAHRRHPQELRHEARLDGVLLRRPQAAHLPAPGRRPPDEADAQRQPAPVAQRPPRPPRESSSCKSSACSARPATRPGAPSARAPISRRGSARC